MFQKQKYEKQIFEFARRELKAYNEALRDVEILLKAEPEDINVLIEAQKKLKYHRGRLDCIKELAEWLDFKIN